MDLNNDKFDFSNKIFSNFKKTALNHIKNISSIKSSNKNLKIDVLNSNTQLNSINYQNMANTYKNENYFNTEKLFYKKEITPYKKNKDKSLDRTNTKEKKKIIKLYIRTNNNNSKNKKNSSNKCSLIKNINKNKNQNTLYISKNINNLNNFKKYKNYSQFNKYISKTSRNNDSLNANIFLNKKSNNILINSFKSRNNILSYYNIIDNKNKNFDKSNYSENSINYKAYRDIRNPYNDNFFYFKKRTNIYKEYYTKSNNIINDSKEKKLEKIGNNTFFNYVKNITCKNRERERQYKIKSEPKKINILKKRKNQKNISELIKPKEIQNKNIIIKKVKYYNIKNTKNYETLQENKNNIYNNFTKRNYYINKGKMQMKSRTNNNSKDKEKTNIYKDKQKIKKLIKSCDIPLIKYKKRKKKSYRFLQLQLKSKKNNLLCQYNLFPNDNSSKKNVCLSKNIKDYFNKRKKKKNNTDIYTYNYEDELCYNMLELDEENDTKKINEIRTNHFDVKKPKEENLKYTIYKDFNNEEKEEELHISKIIIGNIEAYNDIIEKDKKNNNIKKNSQKTLYKDFINKKNNINIIKKIKISFNESNESEKKIINMINFEDEIDNMSTNDFKNNKLNEQINKNVNKNKKNEKFTGGGENKLKIKKYLIKNNQKYNPIKFREKKIDGVNLKIENQKKLLKYKSNIKKQNNNKNNDNIIDKKINLNINKIEKVKTKRNINNSKKIQNKNNSKDLLNQNNLNKNIIENNNSKVENCFIF